MRATIVEDYQTYSFPDGKTLKREWGETPNGNPMNGRWVLRDKFGDMVDFDKYRNDIAERNRLDLY